MMIICSISVLAYGKKLSGKTERQTKESFAPYRLLPSIIFLNTLFYRSYSYWPVGNPPSTPVIAVFVFGFSSLLRNKSLPAFDARRKKRSFLITSNSFVQVLRESTSKKIRTLLLVAKKTTKCYNQWENGWNALKKWSFFFKKLYILQKERINVIIIYSKYFPVSNWLKPHA